MANKMNAFLLDARSALDAARDLTLVIGNESCDLDSAVCSFSLAMFYAITKSDGSKFVPVLNIKREHLPLKTEVVHVFKQFGIDVESLIFIDDINAKHIDAQVVLVDHHVSNRRALPRNITEIVDHRPLDPNANFPDECKVVLQEVGSCATLVAQIILTSRSNGMSAELRMQLLRMLHTVIVLDTVNFSTAADKARELDVSIAAQIEQLIDFDAINRKHLFNELVKARSDVQSLTTVQLLLKDLKIISNSSKTMFVAVPGFPMLVEAFIVRPDSAEAVRSFLDAQKCEVAILMGLTEVDSGHIRRDIGLIAVDASLLYSCIVDALSSTDEINLQLTPKCLAVDILPFAKVFEQHNVRASRKQILPVIQRVLNQF